MCKNKCYGYKEWREHRKGCCLCGKKCCNQCGDYYRMLDYDYKEYRKNCYGDIFKKADCKK